MKALLLGMAIIASWAGVARAEKLIDLDLGLWDTSEAQNNRRHREQMQAMKAQADAQNNQMIWITSALVVTGVIAPRA